MDKPTGAAPEYQPKANCSGPKYGSVTNDFKMSRHDADNPFDFVHRFKQVLVRQSKS